MFQNNASADSQRPRYGLGDLLDLSKGPLTLTWGEECPLSPAPASRPATDFTVALGPVAQSPSKAAVFSGLVHGQGKLVQLGCGLASSRSWSGLIASPPCGHSCQGGRAGRAARCAGCSDSELPVLGLPANSADGAGGDMIFAPKLSLGALGFDPFLMNCLLRVLQVSPEIGIFHLDCFPLGVWSGALQDPDCVGLLLFQPSDWDDDTLCDLCGLCLVLSGVLNTRALTLTGLGKVLSTALATNASALLRPGMLVSNEH